MFVRFGKFIVVVALVAMLGSHWAVLQSVAWTTMLADNLCTQSLTEAVTHTFDGKHPCCLCKAIAAAKKSEKKKEFAVELKKLEFPPPKANAVLIRPSSFHLVPQANTFADSLTQKPPTPPPSRWRGQNVFP
jgi:hypothetical protein